jgi:hypothetical protein
MALTDTVFKAAKAGDRRFRIADKRMAVRGSMP